MGQLVIWLARLHLLGEIFCLGLLISPAMPLTLGWIWLMLWLTPPWILLQTLWTLHAT